MAEILSCPRCQVELSADSPDGLCPECLFRQVIDGRPEGEGQTGSERSPAPRFVPPAAGTLAGHFPSLQVLELLGQGGMGAVYKTRQTKLDRLVALKILPPEVARDPAFAERFTREARSLARLNHPNIVTVYDFGDADGLYYFTMEYVDGRSLRDLLQSGPLPPAQARAIVAQVCDALQYAHDEGLVHRDIKPENILLDRKGRVKIADFGLARLVGLTPAYLTLTGSHEAMGTLLYMAPEQMGRAHTVDHRADIYSLGVVLYEMLTGELPLGRFAPPSRKAAVDGRLDQVVLRALAREPAERHPDAAAFKQDVEAALATPAASELGCVGARREGQQQPTHGRPVWPPARFEIHAPDGKVAARGLLGREDEALILEFEFAKKNMWKKFKSFFKEPDGPQEVRVPLRELASLSYGWGWGIPPRSLILKGTRLRTLAGVPGSEMGQVRLFIPRGDRPAARRLVESLAAAASDGNGPRPAGLLFDPEQARLEVRVPAVGLQATGVLTLLFWALACPVLWWAWIHEQGPYWMESPETPFLLIGTLGGGAVVALVSGVLLKGGVTMSRLRDFPWAATAAILAMIPWSPGWLVGLPCGIWACVVLGRPTVGAAFRGDKGRAASAPVGARPPGGGVGGRALALLRSVGRYFVTMRPGHRTEAGNPPGASPSAIESPAPGNEKRTW
jgi:tRNA A-37 threonylcarbamoyl transferase component Bud32